MGNRKIMSLQIGKPRQEIFSNVKIISAMNKKSLDKVAVTKSSIVGDGVGNIKYHGGPDRAVCFYPFEHYSMWNQKFSKQLDIPAFGENITVTGMIEAQTYIGDIYQIGETIVQITQGRIPCSTISNFNQEPEFLKAVLETNYTGYFAKVVQEGEIKKQDEIVLLDRLKDTISVFYATEVILKKRDGQAGIHALLSVDSLAEDWKQRLLKRLHT